MTLPAGLFKVNTNPASFSTPDDVGRPELTTDFERGGVALNDSSQGLNSKNWRARLVGNDIMISADPYDVETIALTVLGVTEVSIAFDQLMSPTIAYMVGTQSYLWWYDSSVPGRVTTTLATDVRSPFLSMDDKRETAGARNDILLVYLRGDTVYYRQQRDRFATEYTIYAFAQTVEKITRVGLSSDLRFNVEVKFVNPWAGDDPYWANVVLLARFNGTNGLTSFYDESIQHQTLSRTGTAVITTARSKFTDSSLSLPGASQINVTDVPSMRFLGGDFTMEGWFYFTSVGSSTKVFSKRAWSSPVGGLSLHYYSGGWTFQFAYASSPTGLTSFNLGTSAPPQNQWVHVAITKNGTAFRLFVDGTQVGATQTFTSAALAEDSVTPFTIGGPVENNSYMTGNVNEVRITAGVARYVANFTPPSAPFPDDNGDPPSYGLELDPFYANVVLLAMLNGHEGSTNLLDRSQYAHPISGVGAGQVSTSTVKFGTSSVYFDGTVQVAWVPNHASFAMTTENFTWEGFYFFANTGTKVRSLYGKAFDTGYFPINIRREIDGSIVAKISDGTPSIPSIQSQPVADNVWHHIALTRSGTILTLWINGVSVATTTIAAGFTLHSSSAPICLNNYSYDYALGVGGYNGHYGYIDSVRLTKGVCRYTANFTPLTRAFGLSS